MKINKRNSAMMALKLTKALSEVFNKESINYIWDLKSDKDINDFLYALLASMPANVVNELWILWKKDILDVNHIGNRLIIINS